MTLEQVKQLTRTDTDNTTLAVAAIVLAGFVLSLGDAFIKRISPEFTLWQIFVIRSAIAIPVLVALITARHRLASLRPLHLRWTALRSLLLTFMWVAYYAALPRVDLSVAAAAYYTLPIFITLFAAIFVGEPIRARGWVAVLLGFSGVLLILRPRANEFNAYALLPIASAVLYAFAMIITRTKCRRENPLVLSLGLQVSFVGTGALATLVIGLLGSAAPDGASYPFLLGSWTAMGAGEWLAMGLLSGAVLVGSVGTAIAYQRGPSSMVATFDFSYVAFAAVWGFFLFAEVPDPITVAGIVLIVVAGTLAVRR